MWSVPRFARTSGAGGPAGSRNREAALAGGGVWVARLDPEDEGRDGQQGEAAPAPLTLQVLAARHARTPVGHRR
jgi:hypothetical protein